MGLAEGELASLLIGGGLKAGSGALSSAFAPSPFQPRHSFAGGAADPTAGIVDLQSMLKEALGGIQGQSISLPDATVAPLAGLTDPGSLKTPLPPTGPVRLPAQTTTGTTPSQTMRGPQDFRTQDGTGPDTVGTGMKSLAPPPDVASPQRLGYAPDTGVAPAGNAAPGGLDPQTYGAIQLLMHAVKGTGQGVTA